MNSIIITYNKKSYTRKFPSEWKEMGRDHIISFSYTLSLNLPDKEIRKTILFKWLKVPATAFFSIPKGIIQELEDLLDFLFEENIACNTLFIETMNCKMQTFYGPGKRFCNLTVGEYAYAESYMNDYLTDKDKKHLKLLAAVLYRKTNHFAYKEYKESFADPRIEFNDRLIEKNANRMDDGRLYMQHAIFFNFLSFHQWVKKNNTSLYSKVENARGSSGWAGIIHSLAGPQLGTIEAVEKMTFNNALAILKKLEMDRQQIEAEINASNNSVLTI